MDIAIKAKDTYGRGVGTPLDIKIENKQIYGRGGGNGVPNTTIRAKKRRVAYSKKGG